MNTNEALFDALVGKAIVAIHGLEKYSDNVTIEVSSGKSYVFHHYQACCEQVQLVDFECDIEDGAIVLSAREEVSESRYRDHSTWTFYKIRTTKGELWMRWLGESNGYYSEEVTFEEVPNER